MKKIVLCLVSIVLSIFVLSSCSINNYKPISIKYKNSSYAPYTDGESKTFLIDLLNNSKWINDVAKCGCDYTIIMKNDREIYYHSECGTFIDYDFNKSLKISEEERIKLNDYFVEVICKSGVHFFNEEHKCTACGYTTIIGGAFEFEYVASEEGHCPHKVGEQCNGTCDKSPHEDMNNDMLCDICGYKLSN